MESETATQAISKMTLKNRKYYYNNKEERQRKNKEYYEANKDKWLGDNGYVKKCASKKKPAQTMLEPVIFTATHPSGVEYVGASRSLKAYLQGVFIRQTLGKVGPFSEWKIEVIETFPIEMSLSELRKKGRATASARGCAFLKPKEVAGEAESTA